MFLIQSNKAVSKFAYSHYNIKIFYTNEKKEEKQKAPIQNLVFLVCILWVRLVLKEAHLNKT